MYFGNSPELTEHLYTENRSKCLEMKLIDRRNSLLIMNDVQELISGKKIVSIIEELEVIE